MPIVRAVGPLAAIPVAAGASVRAQDQPRADASIRVKVTPPVR